MGVLSAGTYEFYFYSTFSFRSLAISISFLGYKMFLIITLLKLLW